MLAVLAEHWIAVFWLARAIEGEGAAWFDNRAEVGAWIAQTAINRSHKSWWVDQEHPLDPISQIVTRDFHGADRVDIPSRWAVELAAEVLENPPEHNAGGALFMLDRRDLVTLNAWHRRGEAVQVFTGPNNHQLYFFTNWVGEE